MSLYTSKVTGKLYRVFEEISPEGYKIFINNALEDDDSSSYEISALELRSNFKKKEEDADELSFTEAESDLIALQIEHERSLLQSSASKEEKNTLTNNLQKAVCSCNSAKNSASDSLVGKRFTSEWGDVTVLFANDVWVVYSPYVGRTPTTRSRPDFLDTFTEITGE